LAYGFLRKVFEVFEKYRTPIDMITTSEVAVSVTIDNAEHVKKIVQELEPFGPVEVDFGQTIVSIVGNQIASSKDILQTFFSSIHHIPVRMISFGGSPHNITILIPEKYTKEILQLINKGVFGL
jgi:aspartate kinase